MKKSNYQQYDSHSLEKLLFGTETYLEDNSFATGHQLVNVYGEPQKRYEIRSEENAIDVQVHGASEYLPIWADDKQNSGPSIDEIKDVLIGQTIFHYKFKNGVIEGFDNNTLIIKFADGNRKFNFPDCLKTYIYLTNAEIRQTVKDFFSLE